MNTHQELIYQDLQTRYKKSTLSKKEMAIKLGIAKNVKVVFNIIDVAEFLSQTSKTA